MALKVASIGRPNPRVEIFKAAGIEVVEAEPATTEQVIDVLKDADGALIGIWPLTDRQVLEASPKLKVVSRSGVGVDSIDLEAATELGICACNTPGINTSEVADHAMALLLSITRLVPEQRAAIKEGKWSDDPKLMLEFRENLRRIAGHTMGIFGLGNIGKAFASRVRGFGPERIIAYDPYVPQTTADLYGVQLVDFEELLAESDFITVHSPATEETNHIFDRTAFEKMKSTAILINCARGPIVDPASLFVALKEGAIEAAGIDVTEMEPISPEDPLLTLPNLTITPHTAGSSPTSGAAGSLKQAENVLRILQGQAPHGLANPEVIKRIAVMRATDPGRWAETPDFSTALAL